MWKELYLTYPVALLLVRVCLGSQLFDTQKEAHSITDFVNANLLQDGLVHLEEVIPVDVVFLEEFLVLSTLDTP